uniref:Uncharacterized protein n=1 Tax=Anopheles maculatus TaxID=74869 RepID=A0A182SDG3_9DIPT
MITTVTTRKRRKRISGLRGLRSTVSLSLVWVLSGLTLDPPQQCSGAPSLAAKSWPSMKTYDIWGAATVTDGTARSNDSFDPVANRYNGTVGTGSVRRSRYSYGEPSSVASFYGDASHRQRDPGDGAPTRRRSAKGKLKLRTAGVKVCHLVERK